MAYKLSSEEQALKLIAVVVAWGFLILWVGLLLQNQYVFMAGSLLALTIVGLPCALALLTGIVSWVIPEILHFLTFGLIGKNTKARHRIQSWFKEQSERQLER